MKINYMVVRQRDSQPVEVVPFENFDDAVRIFENMRLSWTETYICRVIGGEGHALKNEDDLKDFHSWVYDEGYKLFKEKQFESHNSDLKAARENNRLLRMREKI